MKVGIMVEQKEMLPNQECNESKDQKSRKEFVWHKVLRNKKGGVAGTTSPH